MSSSNILANRCTGCQGYKQHCDAVCNVHQQLVSSRAKKYTLSFTRATLAVLLSYMTVSEYRVRISKDANTMTVDNADLPPRLLGSRVHSCSCSPFQPPPLLSIIGEDTCDNLAAVRQTSCSVSFYTDKRMVAVLNRLRGSRRFYCREAFHSPAH